MSCASSITLFQTQAYLHSIPVDLLDLHHPRLLFAVDHHPILAVQEGEGDRVAQGEREDERQRENLGGKVRFHRFAALVVGSEPGVVVGYGGPKFIHVVQHEEDKPTGQDRNHLDQGEHHPLRPPHHVGVLLEQDAEGQEGVQHVGRRRGPTVVRARHGTRERLRALGPNPPHTYIPLGMRMRSVAGAESCSRLVPGVPTWQPSEDRATVLKKNLCNRSTTNMRR